MPAPTETAPGDAVLPTDATTLPTLMNQWGDRLADQGLLTALTLLLLAAALAHAVARFLLRRISRGLSLALNQGEEPELLARCVNRIASLAPSLIVNRGIGLMPGLSEDVLTVVHNVTTALMILSVVMTATGALRVLDAVYQRRPDARARPIKGYVQLVSMLLYAAGLILVIAALTDRSPLLLLSGLGAMAAVLLLVFKDTLLSLVAAVQIRSADLVRLGDWIEMPQLNANGDVIDIALHTVKVQNWDKTITTIPAYRLISESFKNWRGMHQSGGRRIKRSLLIDQGSARFLTPEEVRGLHRFALLRDYLRSKEQEIAEWNAEQQRRLAERAEQDGPADPALPAAVNQRRLTNLGTFRAYVRAYVAAHPGIHPQMTQMVRQLEPTPQGLPLEIYCFTAGTAWVNYEGIQADLFDHLLAILPEFGLRLFQQPSGGDLQALRGVASAH